MKQVYRIDSNGFFIEPVIIENSENAPVDCVEKTPPMGLQCLKYVNNQWVEGLTPEEVTEIENEPESKTETETLQEQNAELNLQIIDIWETLISGGLA